MRKLSKGEKRAARIEYWREMIAKQTRSGIAVERFCEEKILAIYTTTRFQQTLPDLIRSLLGHPSVNPSPAADGSSGAGHELYLRLARLVHCRCLSPDLRWAWERSQRAFGALDAVQPLRPRKVRSIRTFMASGDSVAVSTHERFREQFGIALRECLAMTETSLTICNPAGAIRPGSLGRVVDGVKANVVDSTGKELPDGQTGELIVKTPVNLVGYWITPLATREALRDGWFLTGDLVRRDSDGYFWFEGRKKQIIVRDGFNISPQEVEEALYTHPAVLEAGVIGMPDPVKARGQRVLAFVALRDGYPTNGDELRVHARGRLADLKVPEEIVFLEKLPKGISGKIDRAALKQLQLVAA